MCLLLILKAYGRFAYAKVTFGWFHVWWLSGCEMTWEASHCDFCGSRLCARCSVLRPVSASLFWKSSKRYLATADRQIHGVCASCLSWAITLATPSGTQIWSAGSHASVRGSSVSTLNQYSAKHDSSLTKSYRRLSAIEDTTIRLTQPQLPWCIGSNPLSSPRGLRSVNRTNPDVQY